MQNQSEPPAIRVLVLGSYPCQTPLHGGQIRLAEIVAAYARSGTEVRVCSVFDETSYTNQSYGPLDVVYPGDSPFRQWQGQSFPLIDDLTAGLYAAQDQDAYARLSQLLEYAPDILHLEQPWLLPLVLRWRAEGHLQGAILVYGSQNLEAPLKAAILRQYEVAGAQPVIDAIEVLERQACATSDLVLAVSNSDRAALQALSSTPVQLAANGIAPWQATQEALDVWRPQLPSNKFALFVASAHPPNISGFFDMCGPALGFIPPDTRLVVAGSVGPELVHHPQFQRWQPLNASRLQVLGIVDDTSLAAIKTLAGLFVLPITEGGGSNIKTAEALYSGAQVLGTPVSFRGFDSFLTLPGVHCQGDPAVFRSTMGDLLLDRVASQVTGVESEIQRRQSLLWRETLAPIEALVHQRKARQVAAA